MAYLRSRSMDASRALPLSLPLALPDPEAPSGMDVDEDPEGSGPRRIAAGLLPITVMARSMSSRATMMSPHSDVAFTVVSVTSASPSSPDSSMFDAPARNASHCRVSFLKCR